MRGAGEPSVQAHLLRFKNARHAILTRLRRELPHFTPSVVAVTAKDLSRVELRRLSEQTLAVFRKDGELERELKQVLHGVWERGVAETALAGAAPA